MRLQLDQRLKEPTLASAVRGRGARYCTGPEDCPGSDICVDEKKGNSEVNSCIPNNCVCKAAPRERYNCRTKERWSSLKREYCCSTYGLGCPSFERGAAQISDSSN